MSTYTEFLLPSGATVFVQSRTAPPPAHVREGTEQATGLEDKARQTWEEGVDLVRELAQGIVAKLKAATAAADECTVEFGVNLSGKTGIILVEGEVEANLKVSIKWGREKVDGA